MEKIKEYEFNKLNPEDSIEDLDYYEKALDFALEDKEIQNIAITGMYGSGKSSILESYKNKKNCINNKKFFKCKCRLYNKNKYIHISLAHFKSTESIKNNNAEDKKEKERIDGNNNEMSGDTDSTGIKIKEEQTTVDNKVLEGKILNQLLHQIDSKAIPQSIFKLKTNTNLLDIIMPTLFIMISILTFLYVFNFTAINLYFSSIFPNFISTKYFQVASWTVFMIEIGLIIFNLIKLQLNKKIFKQLSIRSANIQSDIEIFKDSDESYFDKYLDDVIYLFNNSGAEVIVFEDIDRFENNIIFSKLKEINTLVNNRRDKEKKEKVTFIYMLRDDMFLSKERTKFFDFILPIVPIIDSSNSYDKLKELLEKQPSLRNSKLDNLFQEFDNNFLLKISIYIDDMRLLKNIVNEFIIYYEQLNLLALDINKLFAIIVYKNIFPTDFVKLQLNQGFIYQIINNKAMYIEEKKEEIEDKIKDLKKQIKNGEEEKLAHELELYSIYFTGKSQYDMLEIDGKSERDFDSRLEFIKEIKAADYQITGKRAGYSGSYSVDLSKEFKKIESDPKFIKRFKNIKNKSKKTELQGEIHQLEDEMKILLNKSIYEVIETSNIQDTRRQHFTGITEKFKEIKTNSYFDLLIFLIINGYIDEDYSNYLTYFHENSLGLSEKEFLRNVYSRGPANYELRLQNISEIYNRLSNIDFLNECVLNFSLIKFVFRDDKLENRSERLQNYFKQINQENNLFFFINYYEREEIETRNEVLKYLIIFSPDLLRKIIQNNVDITAENKNEIVIDALNFYTEKDLTEFENDQDVIVDFINTSDLILQKANSYNENFMKNIEYMDIKFKTLHLNNVPSELADFIYEHNLYAINQNNIQEILIYYYKEIKLEQLIHSNYTFIVNTGDSFLHNYVENNINDYLIEYLSFSENKVHDKLTAIYRILNNEFIDLELIEEYIESLVNQKLLLNKIENKSFHTQLVENKQISLESENILIYFKYCEEKWTLELLSFVNEHKNELRFEYPVGSKKFDSDFKRELFRQTVCEERLDNKVYKKILEKLNWFYKDGFSNENLSDNKVSILIDLKIIRFTKDTLSDLRKYYPDIVIYFISNNLEDYLDLIEDSNLYNSSEIIDVLDYHNKSPVQIQYQIIKSIKEPISIEDKKFNAHVVNYILKNKHNNEDISFLIQNYEEFAKITQIVIIELFVEQIDYIIDNELVLKNRVLEILLGKDEISLENRQLLFSRNINKIERTKLKKTFIKLGLNNFIEVINENRRNFEFNMNEINEKILIYLTKKDLISSYKEENYCYIVNSKQQKNLI